jgi:hypothetical protein
MVRFNKKDLPEKEQLLNGMAEIDEDTFRPISNGEFICLQPAKNTVTVMTAAELFTS